MVQAWVIVTPIRGPDPTSMPRTIVARKLAGSYSDCFQYLREAASLAQSSPGAFTIYNCSLVVPRLIEIATQYF